MDEEEDSPLLQETGMRCLFQCVGGGSCEDGRCCDVTGNSGENVNGTGYGSTGST